MPPAGDQAFSSGLWGHLGKSAGTGELPQAATEMTTEGSLRSRKGSPKSWKPEARGQPHWLKSRHGRARPCRGPARLLLPLCPSSGQQLTLGLWPPLSTTSSSWASDGLFCPRRTPVPGCRTAALGQGHPGAPLVAAWGAVGRPPQWAARAGLGGRRAAGPQGLGWTEPWCPATVLAWPL